MENRALVLSVTPANTGGRQKYAVAVLAFVGGGGNHSYYEIAIVLAAAGLTINPDSYHGVEPLIGSELFAQLKAQHPGAFHDAPAKTSEPT